MVHLLVIYIYIKKQKEKNKIINGNYDDNSDNTNDNDNNNDDVDDDDNDDDDEDENKDELKYNSSELHSINCNETILKLSKLLANVSGDIDSTSQLTTETTGGGTTRIINIVYLLLFYEITRIIITIIMNQSIGNMLQFFFCQTYDVTIYMIIVNAIIELECLF